MDLEKIIEIWKEDSKEIDQTKLMEFASRLPLLHSKYLDHLTYFKIRHRAAINKYNNLKQVRYKYYRGALTKEELDAYGWQQWQLSANLKSDIDKWLESDQVLNEQTDRIEYYKTCIEALEYIMKELSGRNFLVKSMVELRKIEVGM